MPTAPPTRCSEAGCPTLVTTGRCDEHRRKSWSVKQGDRQGSTRAERKMRDRVLREQPICAMCGDAPSTEDDHIIPIRDGGSRYDRANHQGLCTDCHSVKTRAEHARRMARLARGR